MNEALFDSRCLLVDPCLVAERFFHRPFGELDYHDRSQKRPTKDKRESSREHYTTLIFKFLKMMEKGIENAVIVGSKAISYTMVANKVPQI